LKTSNISTMKLYALVFHICLFIISFNFASAQNNSLNFDGDDDYIKVDGNSTHDVSNAVTIEAWVYPTNDNWGNIVMKGNYGYGFALSGTGGTGSCGSSNNLVFWDQSQCGSTIRSTLTYVQYSWQHVAVTVQAIGPQLEIYFFVNGVADGPYYSSQSLNNGNGDNALYIGTQGLGLGNYFTGNMDELRIWTIVRTPEQILAGKNTELDPQTQLSLALYYSFNQGVGGADNSAETVALDRTVNNNNGEVTNFALIGSTSNWVGESPAALPITLIEFKAARKAANAELSWSTEQEQQSSSFEIQHIENNHFVRIGNVPAAGNSNHRIDYHFTDVSPLAGNNLYRLKQIDTDGKFQYSPIVKINFPSANSLKLRGNPVQTELKLIYTSVNKGQLELAITNSLGAVVVQRKIAIQAGDNEIVMPVIGMNSGSYLVRAISGEWKQVLKFYKM